MFTQRVKNRHCLSVASLTVFQLNLLVISEWSVWVVLWNFLHKKFPPSAQDKKTILPPQAVPLPLQGRLNVSLTEQPHLNPPSQGREKKTAQQIARLRNKCAMPDHSHAELISVSCGLNPSPAFQAPSPQVARGKIRSVGDMKENIFSNMVNSPFTYSYRYGLFRFHFSLFT